MAKSVLTGVEVKGIASAVPETTRSLEDEAQYFGTVDAQKIGKSTGVQRRHVVVDEMCTSDLCFVAAESLLSQLGWERESIDVLIFVSQTPDYLLPATGCSLQARLGLGTHCAAFDVPLGCSGYVYGLWLAANLIAAGGARRVLLLVGDTISRIVSPQDRAVAPLFGDAGTATALERSTGAPAMHFELGTDGSGQDHLIVPAGGFRRPRTAVTAERTVREGGNVRSDEDLFMNGPEIFAFTLREVRPLINSLLSSAGWPIEMVDAFVMHQANRFMLQHLAKGMKLPSDRVVLAMEDYGNTSSASIPLAMTHALARTLSDTRCRLVLAGFGVGFSWGAAALECGPIVMPELIKVSKEMLEVG